MKKVLFISLVSIACIFYSCKNEPEIVILTTTSDVLNLNPINGNQSLSISSNSVWSAKSSDSWCTLSDSTGTGNKEVVVLCKDNLSGLARETKITINSGNQSKSVVVKQTGGQVLLDENFSNNLMNWNIINNDSISENINNGFYVIKNSCKVGAYFVGTKSIISNFTGNYMITSKYYVVSGTQPFGLTFGYKDNQNFYRILIYPWGGYSITMRLNNVNTSIINGSITFKNENTISLLKIGKNCDVYINDSKINSFDLSTPFGSYIGFYSCAQTEINIDNFKVVQF